MVVVVCECVHRRQRWCEMADSHVVVLLFCCLLLLLVTRSLSDPRSSVAALVCSHRATAISTRRNFISNVVSAMDTATPQVSSQHFAKAAVGSGNATVYAFAQCMADLSRSDCDLCFAQSKIQIPKCFTYQNGTRGGRFFLDGCYLRYDDYDFYEEDTSDEDKTVCGGVEFAQNQTEFKRNTLKLLRNLSSETPINNGFFASYVFDGSPNSTTYGLAQCWEVLNRSSCSNCLNHAVSNITSCLPQIEGRALNSGCYLRYSTQKFYNTSSADTPPRRRGRRLLAVIVAVCSSVLAVLMIGASATFYGRKKFLKRREEQRQLDSLALRKSELNFRYETLEKATNYFDASNKLGEGGSGSVYKGTLADGRKIAVKRLFFSTKQWVDEFFNEVNLVSKIHHQNLVKLLGCSITGPESLLVYEYIPNKSVHHYLFDKINFLNWEMRCRIIVGTAEGLAYLHDESGYRVIHRDIKLGNILLDDDFTPKIADFGLARFYPEDKTHISTGIAGTLGYMAPEYLVCGKITEKVDVYSFGVSLIEIICGRRNSNCYGESLHLLHMVWGYFISDRLLDAVDPSLEGRFSTEEASRILQIGLLCSQVSAELRPSMSTVVGMLKINCAIPAPTQPPFLNTNPENLIVGPEKSYSLLKSSEKSSESMTNCLLGPG